MARRLEAQAEGKGAVQELEAIVILIALLELCEGSVAR
jgi:hypothetical protein